MNRPSTARCPDGFDLKGLAAEDDRLFSITQPQLRIHVTDRQGLWRYVNQNETMKKYPTKVTTYIGSKRIIKHEALRNFPVAG